MKDKLWLLQLPFVILFTFCFWVTEMGVEGRLEHPVLRNKVFPALRSLQTTFVDWKFKIRGPEAPKNKIVIVEIDSASIEMLGRWPWHRDATGLLIEKIFEAGPKVVGLDMVFSEPDERVPPELKEVLNQANLGQVAGQFETDLLLSATIQHHSDKLVLGWASEGVCQPLYENPEQCPVTHEKAIADLPKGIEKFSYSIMQLHPGFDPQRTPLFSAATMIGNIEMFNQVASHSGYFNANTDPDGFIRRSPMLMLVNGKAHPSLPLEMARVGLGERLQVTFDSLHRVKSLGFANSGQKIPVSPVGVAEINFRGPGRSFQYVSAAEILHESDVLADPVNRKLAGVSKKELLKDAYVLVGLSAIGVYDMRNFPFETGVPGVEGHAFILDNILSGDFLTRGKGESGPQAIYLLMIFGAILFAFLVQKLESVPALILGILVFGGIGAIDVKVLFQSGVNWNSSFLYVELFTIFVFTLAAKYVIEERNKKFVRGAFAKYVAPAVVDSILKDPAKLTVGGEKRDLTILFSDIRGFTTFSERMDAKALSQFLNDYLGIQTEIIFKNEGTLDKYIGDAIMAFWGAPLDQPKHAYNACKTAIEMMKALGQNLERYKTQYGVDVAIGIGLNSGVVSVGNMGSSNNFAYTVIGDHVNLASRLEGLTKYYGVAILTSRYTFDYIHQCGAPMLPHRVLDFVKVKGKKNAVELIQVLERDLPEEGLKLFEEGRLLYTQQKWDEAIQKFLSANALLACGPDEMDGPCEEYLNRCEEFKKNPPGPDWDGSWEMHSK